MKIKVGIVQHKILEGNKEYNSSYIKTILEGADINDIDLLVFPELFLSGYPYSEFYDNASSIENSFDLKFLSGISKKYDCICTGGSFIEKNGNSYFNTMPLVDTSANLVKFYRKIHLFSPMSEDRYFQKGKEVVAVDSRAGKIGLTLCYDLRFPELYRVLALNGCNIIIVAAEFPKPRLSHWLTLLKARAIENQVFIIAVNRAGKNKKYEFLGHSCIIDPWGEPLLLLDDKQEGVFIKEINLVYIKEVRNNIPCFKTINENPCVFKIMAGLFN